MSIDLKNSLENKSWNNIEQQIDRVISEIEKEYKMWKKTLENLLSFKLEKWIEETSKNSLEYRTALISEIQKKANLWEITSFDGEKRLWTEEYELLANKLIEISKLKEKTQSWIEELRAEMIKDFYTDNLFVSKTLITKNFYSPKTLAKLDNPEWFTDNLIWFWIWTIETLAIIWKFSLEALEWLIKSPIHLIQLAKWDAKLETNIKI